MKISLSLITLSASCMLSTGAVTITSWTQVVFTTADDSTIASSVTTNSNTGYPHSNDLALANQGVASSEAEIDYTGLTVGLPAALNLPVPGFDLQFEARVGATVASGTVGSSADAFVALGFFVEVLDGEADFTFAQTGSDADFRFIVSGVPAVNAAQTLRLGVGTYQVLFSDGAGASTDAIDQEDSEQKNLQNYSLRITEVIPEPSTALLGSLGLLGLLRRRR